LLLPCYESEGSEEMEVIGINSLEDDEMNMVNCYIDCREKHALLKPFMEIK
jgi:hypothetical protein